MLKLETLEDINGVKVMQVASSRDNQPWVATVYFVVFSDTSGNLSFYWLSYPDRRHSLELHANPKAAIAIAIKHDQPVFGFQAEGTVSVVNDAHEVKKIASLYIKKYSQGHDFYSRFKEGTNTHQLYEFKVDKYTLFDERP